MSEYTPQFSEMMKASQACGERNDCTVKAMAVVTKIPYEKARTELQKAGRVPGRGFRMDKVVETTARQGFRVASPIKPAKLNGSQYSMTTIGRIFPKGTYYVLMSKGRHVAAMVDGIIHDWSASGRRRVCALYEIKESVTRATNRVPKTQMAFDF